jgi:adenylosuccinate lyase
VAYALILKDCNNKVLIPHLNEVLRSIKHLAITTKRVPFLARTHGQPAVSTTFGKEMANYFSRVRNQVQRITSHCFEAKCNGAVGNYNALQFVYPQKDWIHISSLFIEKFGLSSNLFTTQILPYDNWIEFFQKISLTNMICIDLSINVWNYIMLEVLKQAKEKGEVGSSTMPQKINPIAFE